MMRLKLRPLPALAVHVPPVIAAVPAEVVPVVAEPAPEPVPPPPSPEPVIEPEPEPPPQPDRETVRDLGDVDAKPKLTSKVFH